MELQLEKLGKVSITVEKDYWDINKEYDKLTIVERAGTATTYLSRKNVPSGVSILDREYWIRFSKFVDNITEPVQEFGDSTEIPISQKAITEKVNEIDSNFENLNNNVNEKITKVETYTNNIIHAISMLSPEQQEALSIATELVNVQNALGGYSIRTLSEEEYQSLATNEQLDENTLYFIEEDEDEET